MGHNETCLKKLVLTATITKTYIVKHLGRKNLGRRVNNRLEGREEGRKEDRKLLRIYFVISPGTDTFTKPQRDIFSFLF